MTSYNVESSVPPRAGRGSLKFFQILIIVPAARKVQYFQECITFNATRAAQVHAIFPFKLRRIIGKLTCNFKRERPASQRANANARASLCVNFPSVMIIVRGCKLQLHLSLLVLKKKGNNNINKLPLFAMVSYLQCILQFSLKKISELLRIIEIIVFYFFIVLCMVSLSVIDASRKYLKLSLVEFEPTISIVSKNFLQSLLHQAILSFVFKSAIYSRLL